MFNKLTVFQLSSAMANHAGKRQALVAQNIANADTPDYRAQDLEAFDTALQKSTDFEWSTTRKTHITPSSVTDTSNIVQDTTGGIEPNGNTVSIDNEMLRAVDVQKQHSRAIAIYKSAMTILRTSVKG